MTKAKRPSAYNLALQQVQARSPEPGDVPEAKTTAEDRKVVIPQNGETPQNSEGQQGSTGPQNGAKKLEKITFYLEPEQVEKLYDLMHTYRKRTGLRINRNDVIRRLIDVSSIDTVLPSDTVKP